MTLYRAPKRQATFDPCWNPDVVKAELRKKDRSVRAILRSHETPTTGWQGLYRDMVRWRQEDPEMNRLALEHIRSVSKLRGSGRKKLDQTPETDGWMNAFCEKYLRTRNKSKSADVTPYKYESILKMLDPGRTEYSEKFASMVHACDMQFLDWAKEIAFQSLQEAIDQQISPEKRANIAIQIARYAKGTDWGNQKLDVSHSGTIRFEARRAQETSELVASQRDFFQKHRAHLLESGERNSVGLEKENEMVIEGELLES